MPLTKQQRELIKRKIDEKRRRSRWYDHERGQIVLTIGGRAKQKDSSVGEYRRPMPTKKSRLSEDDWKLAGELWDQGWMGSDIAFSFKITFGNLTRGLQARNIYQNRHTDPDWSRKRWAPHKKLIDWIAVAELLEDGNSIPQIARIIGLSKQQLYRRMKAEGFVIPRTKSLQNKEI